MDNIEKILSHVRTQAEAQELLSKLDAFAATMYSVKEHPLQDYFSHLPKDIADTIYEVFAGLSASKGSGVLQTVINQLQDRIHASRTVQLTLAFEADDATVSLFSDWAKKNIGADALLDIQINKSLVGGAIIVADGQYRDYSVRKKLTQVFQIQREDLMGGLSATK